MNKKKIMASTGLRALKLVCVLVHSNLRFKSIHFNKSIHFPQKSDSLIPRQLVVLCTQCLSTLIVCSALSILAAYT